MILYGIERNPVVDKIHMSGECLCGSYAHPGEKEEIKMWFPEVVEYIENLEKRAQNKGLKSHHWGPSQYRKMEIPNTNTGPMCTSCDAKMSDKTSPEEIAKYYTMNRK